VNTMMLPISPVSLLNYGHLNYGHPEAVADGRSLATTAIAASVCLTMANGYSTKNRA